ncbi:MAG: preprotein translocase subunit YajC [Prolixibacteraceae bacterium]|nr:preprotein translocase subunit YajC [Prolixibacteraceae bacterium]MBN2772937.1 preprotein translocase subunit YajC [Prolixibacteraceae bacterium]
MPQEGAEPGDMWKSFIPLILIVVVFYFFMIRPQVKRQKETRQFRESLKKGDNVVTTGGIYGKIIEVKETTVILQIDKEVKIKVDKAGIIKDMSEAPQPK